MDQLRDQLAQDPLMETMVEELFREVASVQEQLAQLRDARGQEAQLPENRAFTPPPNDVVQRLDAFEDAIGPLPLSVRAWCEIVGSVDFIGEYPGLASFQHEGFDMREMIRGMLRQSPGLANAYREMDEAQLRAQLASLPFPIEHVSGLHEIVREEMASGEGFGSADRGPATWIGDPLYFRFDVDEGKARTLVEDQLADRPPAMDAGGAGFLLDVAPDRTHKANMSGDAYSVVLPDASADAYLHGTDLHFVAYLRNSFLWGGFPGLENHEGRDNALIVYLREGLEPL
jgi:hypothetical protein